MGQPQSGNKGKNDSATMFDKRLLLLAGLKQGERSYKSLEASWLDISILGIFPFDLVVAIALFRYGLWSKLPDSERRSWTHFLMKTRRSETDGLQTLRLLQENVVLKRLG